MNNSIADQIKAFAESVDLYDIVERIGQKFNLHIDQIGALDAEIRDILNGVRKSTDFSKDIIERLEVDHTLAESITKEVNNEVFLTLRTNLQNQTMPDAESLPETENIPAQNNTSLEKAGNFSVETEKPDAKHDVTSDDRSALLFDLENPAPGIKTVVKKGPDPYRESNTL